MNQNVLDLFERQVCASPDAAAIVCDERLLTYAQLNQAAEQIAAALHAMGDVAGCLVGLLVDRSPEMIAALIGIWKAGAAWLPLDHGAPDERIQFMLNDAGLSLVITHKKFSNRFSGVRSLYLEDLCSRKRSTIKPARAAVRTSAAGARAYAIYTSGSTGTPKAAQVTHGGLANTLQGVADDLQLTPEDIVLAWSTLAFDVACLEIWLPLTLGASLYLLQNNTAREGGPTPEQVHRSAATVMFGTPTMYRLLLERGWPGNLRMQIAVGGEALPLPLARTLARVCRSVWNQYGPTEAAICATRTRINAHVERISIGTPLPNVALYLLDQDRKPVARGAVGELYIAGIGVGLGYLDRPALNKAHFLPDPFAPEPGAMLYKTGDLAIQLSDGSFEFLGRVDHQVKIRGYRIELGEIESALLRCESVQAAVARVIELEAGDPRLVAFVVGDPLPLSGWQQRLRKQLPDYMVPSELVILHSFPTNANGKVDLRALDGMRGQGLSAPALQSIPITAADPFEIQLKAIWEKVLRVSPLGPDDDFFAMGGHSLLAARMLSQVEQWLERKIPHSVLVENPTIRRLAVHLQQAPEVRWPAIVTLQAGTPRPALFIAHGIGGSVLSFVELAAELGRKQPVYGLQLPAQVDPGQTGLKRLAGDYVRQIRALQPRGPYHLVGHSSGGVIAFEMACQLAELGETVGLLALLDCDPNTGKVVRKPFQDWKSFRAALRRAYAELTASEFTVFERVDRRIEYQKLKFKMWLAARAQRRGQAHPGAAAEGYLALALREYEFGSFPGDATLFLAQEEPGREADPTCVWEGKILGEREVVLIPGTHFSMLSRPQVTPLAREIRSRLSHGVSSVPVGLIAASQG